MIPLLIDVEVAHGSVMTIEVGQLLQSVRFPENNVALLSATGHLLVLDGVDEAVDALLMQVERLFGPIVERFKLVHVDEAIQGGRQKHVQILVVLNLGDPAPMRVNFNAGEVLLSAFVLGGTFVLEGNLLFLGGGELSCFILLL